MITNTPNTYTTAQAMEAIGVTRSAFHYLRKQYPKAFIVMSIGKGRSRFTLYNKTAIDDFIKWRKMKNVYDQYVQNRDKYTKEG